MIVVEVNRPILIEDVNVSKKYVIWREIISALILNYSVSYLRARTDDVLMFASKSL